MENNIGLLLTRRAELNRDREAYVDSATRDRWSFGELEARTNQLGNSLVNGGVEPGDRVALLMMNSVEFVESYLALAKVGAIVVPLNWRLVADELEFILKDSGSTLCIYGEEFFDLASDLQPSLHIGLVTTPLQVTRQIKELLTIDTQGRTAVFEDELQLIPA